MTLPSMGPSPPSRCPPLLPNVRRRSGRLRVTMPDFGELINHWGYFAIVLFVILGNVGLPVPEESILVLSGYLAWRGDLKLALVIAVGIIAAAAGDIIGFWIGRRYGHAALDRYRQSMLVRPERLESVTRFLNRYGAFAVFAARFIPGVCGVLVSRFSARTTRTPLSRQSGCLLVSIMVASVGTNSSHARFSQPENLVVLANQNLKNGRNDTRRKWLLSASK